MFQQKLQYIHVSILRGYPQGRDAILKQNIVRFVLICFVLFRFEGQETPVVIAAMRHSENLQRLHSGRVWESSFVTFLG